MAISYAIWLYKEFKHEPEAHWAQNLFPVGPSLFNTNRSAKDYARRTFDSLDWKSEIVPITGEHSLELWADRFRGMLETRSYKQILKDAYNS